MGNIRFNYVEKLVRRKSGYNCVQNINVIALNEPEKQ